MSARVVLVILGVLVILAGLFARAFNLEGAEYAGERATNPDGTVTYYEPEDTFGFEMRGEDGTSPYYVSEGPVATVWQLEPEQEVFRGTPQEAEAYINDQGARFTGTPAEADAWAEAQRQERRSSASLPPTLWIIGGAASIVVGVWPGLRRSDDAPRPEPLPA